MAGRASVFDDLQGVFVHSTLTDDRQLALWFESNAPGASSLRTPGPAKVLSAGSWWSPVMLPLRLPKNSAGFVGQDHDVEFETRLGLRATGCALLAMKTSGAVLRDLAGLCDGLIRLAPSTRWLVESLELAERLVELGVVIPTLARLAGSPSRHEGRWCVPWRNPAMGIVSVSIASSAPPSLFAGMSLRTISDEDRSLVAFDVVVDSLTRARLPDGALIADDPGMELPEADSLRSWLASLTSNPAPHVKDGARSAMPASTYGIFDAGSRGKPVPRLGLGQASGADREVGPGCRTDDLPEIRLSLSNRIAEPYETKPVEPIRTQILPIGESDTSSNCGDRVAVVDDGSARPKLLDRSAQPPLSDRIRLLAFRLKPNSSSGRRRTTFPWRLETFGVPINDSALQFPRARLARNWRADSRVEYLDCSYDDLDEWCDWWPCWWRGEVGDAPPEVVRFSRSCGSGHPWGLDRPLSWADAVDFVEEVAPVLMELGHDVTVPSLDPTPREARLDFDLDLSNSSGLFTLEKVVSFEPRVFLGDVEVESEAFQKAVEQKLLVIEAGGRFVPLDLDSAGEFVKRLSQIPRGHTTVGEVLQLADTWDDPQWLNDPADSIRSRLIRMVGDTRGSAETEFRIRGFKGNLYPYQRDGVAWLASRSVEGLGCCLADDMGLGKTWQVLALVASDRVASIERANAGPGASAATSDRSGVGPTLVVCPRSVIRNWKMEATRLTPNISAVIHHGPNRRVADELARWARLQAIVITTYATMLNDADALAGVNWTRLVLDEAQSIKNPKSKTWKAACLVGNSARHRIVVTGTPIENHPGDLWALMEFTNPGLFGRLTAFNRRFSAPIKRGDKIASSSLQAAVSPLLLRRLKEDVAPDLPEKLELREYCTLTRAQVTLYKAEVEHILRVASGETGIARQGAVLGGLTRLKQICDHPSLIKTAAGWRPSESGKVRRLLEIVDEIHGGGGHGLVFTNFTDMGKMLVRILEDRFGEKVDFYYGDTDEDQRDEMVERFQSGDRRFMVLNPKAGGTGITLSQANHVVHFDRPWNPAVENQATDRAHRIGQTRIVTKHILICNGTLEDRIDELHQQKREMFDTLIRPSDELDFGSLSMAELDRLIRLDMDAGW